MELTSKIQDIVNKLNFITKKNNSKTNNVLDNSLNHFNNMPSILGSSIQESEHSENTNEDSKSAQPSQPQQPQPFYREVQQVESSMQTSVFTKSDETQTSLQSASKNILCNIMDQKYMKQIEKQESSYKEQLNLLKNSSIALRAYKQNEDQYKDVIEQQNTLLKNMAHTQSKNINGLNKKIAQYNHAISKAANNEIDHKDFNHLKSKYDGLLQRQFECVMLLKSVQEKSEDYERKSTQEVNQLQIQNNELKYLLKVDQSSLNQLTKDSEEIKFNDSISTSSNITNNKSLTFETCLLNIKYIASLKKFSNYSYNITCNRQTLKKSQAIQISKTKKQVLKEDVQIKNQTKGMVIEMEFKIDFNSYYCKCILKGKASNNEIKLINMETQESINMVYSAQIFQIEENSSEEDDEEVSEDSDSIEEDDNATIELDVGTTGIQDKDRHQSKEFVNTNFDKVQFGEGFEFKFNQEKENRDRVRERANSPKKHITNDMFNIEDLNDDQEEITQSIQKSPTAQNVSPSKPNKSHKKESHDIVPTSSTTDLVEQLKSSQASTGTIFGEPDQNDVQIQVEDGEEGLQLTSDSVMLQNGVPVVGVTAVHQQVVTKSDGVMLNVNSSVHDPHFSTIVPTRYVLADEFHRYFQEIENDLKAQGFTVVESKNLSMLMGNEAFEKTSLVQSAVEGVMVQLAHCYIMVKVSDQEKNFSFDGIQQFDSSDYHLKEYIDFNQQIKLYNNDDFENNEKHSNEQLN